MQFVAEKKTKEELSPRLKEIQKKIQDENYISYAVDRIAIVMSKRIVEEETSLRSSLH